MRKLINEIIGAILMVLFYNNIEFTKTWNYS